MANKTFLIRIVPTLNKINVTVYHLKTRGKYEGTPLPLSCYCHHINHWCIYFLLMSRELSKPVNE